MIPENRQNSKLILAGILLTSLLLGCGNGDSDTFVRFQIEDQSYEVKDSKLTVTSMPFNVYFFDLNYPHMRLVPGALVQWRMKMKLKSLDQLVGRELDLKLADPNQVEPVVLLRLTEDLSAQGQKHSNIHFKIDRIRAGMVEGSFSGNKLRYFSKTNKTIREVDFAAQFRVKLIQKKASL